ncbi:MAG: hypothetical protein UIH99_00395, partial [Alphaproteobacteria bacterium]|nr:hypothetical protein [Alphaproteobacteria bacterium]
NCTGFPLSCGAGYVSSTNVDLATDFRDLSKNLYYANSPQDAIEKTCVPVGRNNWSSSGQECIGLPDDEVVFCLYEKSLEKNACPDGGITLTDTAGSIEECMLPVVACSTEAGTGVRSCMYEEETGAYTNCDLCSVSSCYSGLYMNNGVCVTCPAGSACSDNNITTCGANTWSTVGGTQCNTCPANSSTNGQTGQTQCICNTGYNYNNGTTVTVNDCVPNTFTVKYDAGLGDGNMADTVCNYDGNCVAADNTFVNIGHNFVGWLCSGGSCNGNIIQAGASLINATVENNAVITLTAQWSISSISCDAGYYLNGDVCAECPDDSFCTGGAWEYNGQIQGLEKCPTITEKYGAASAEFLDVLEHAPHSAANQCRAVFGYAERWYLDFVNNTNVDAGYDEKVNERGLFFVSCDYNPVTRLYDKNCTGVALMCGAGYWSPYNQNTTDVNDLIQNMYIANSPQDAIENTCTQVGDGYWSPSAEGKLDKDANDLLQQLTLQYVGRTQCKDGLHTAGYGKGADEEDDCGRILHIDESVVYLRKDKRTIPSLNVRVDGVVYYGSMSTQETNMNDKSERKLRINYKGVPYWVHDDTML